MSVTELTAELVFPPNEMATEDGLLAIGGNLSLERLILAYKNGIFPWYNDEDPIAWWTPDPRFILFPSELHLPKSFQQQPKEGYEITFDREFAAVIQNCQSIPRNKQDGTWITEEMKAAYNNLFEAGYAHSIEVRDKGKLVGGLYGLAIGKCYFGESMFSLEKNASKYGLIALVNHLKKENFKIIDCQVYSDYLSQFGARYISRDEFLETLKEGINILPELSKWG